MAGLSPVFRGLIASVAFACFGWFGLSLATTPPPLPTKQQQVSANGIIGAEDREPLSAFRPDNPVDFPGWERLGDGVVRISCAGGIGSGFLIGAGDRIVTAAHVLVGDDGRPRPGRQDCLAIHPNGDSAPILEETGKGGAFIVPDALSTHFSVPITMVDWHVVQLERALRGADPIPIATQAQIVLEDGHDVINIAGPQDNVAGSDFFAQVCHYAGVPPSASDVDVHGNLYARVAQPGDEWRVARYDCDIGGGASGSPIIGWFEGAPYVWGIVTDSLRGEPICSDVGHTSCYTAGPLVTGMDIVP